MKTAVLAFFAAGGLVVVACDDAILGVRPSNDASTPEEASTVLDASSDADTRDANGDVSTAGCEDLGGTCATQAACGTGRWSVDASFGCSPDEGCCRACPAVAAPPSSFCDGAPIREVKEGACVTGFRCD